MSPRSTGKNTENGSEMNTVFNSEIDRCNAFLVTLADGEYARFFQFGD